MLFLLRVKETGEQRERARERQTEESDMACNHKINIDICLREGFEQDNWRWVLIGSPWHDIEKGGIHDVIHLHVLHVYPIY